MQPTAGMDIDQQLSAAAQRMSQAIAAMHQPGAPADQLAAANDWLEKFQETDLAWKVLHTICQCMPRSAPVPYRWHLAKLNRMLAEPCRRHMHP